jgi:hypothetical protein
VGATPRALRGADHPAHLALRVRFIDSGAQVAPISHWGQNVKVHFECINHVLKTLIDDRGIEQMSSRTSSPETSSPETPSTVTTLGAERSRTKLKHLRKVMLDIRVCVDCSIACILWRSSRSQNSYLRQRFRLWFRQSSAGRRLHSASSELLLTESNDVLSSPTLRSAVGPPHLPADLEGYFWNRYVQPGHTILVDLNASLKDPTSTFTRWTGPSPHFMYCGDKGLRRRDYQYWSANSFEVRMISSAASQRFSELRASRYGRLLTSLVHLKTLHCHYEILTQHPQLPRFLGNGRGTLGGQVSVANSNFASTSN